jgi:phosphoadenosine phosphosulfate reductase
MTFMGTRFSEPELAAVNAQFESAHPRDILAWADRRFGSRMAQMSSLALEGMAIFDMYWRVNPKARMMTLDTLRLNTETYTLMDQVRHQYKTEIETFYPDMQAVDKMVREKGYNLFYRGVENRKLCCHVRKVEPLKRALADLDAWISGLRRDQGMERGKISIIEWDSGHGLYKVNPLANWTFEQVRKYVDENSVPYNALHDQGYPSIGCAPCTRAIKLGEPPRAGRWWWESDPNAKECGIHIAASPTRPAQEHAAAAG